MHYKWNNDIELFGIIRNVLYTPVVGDVLDGLVYYHRFLPQPIAPLRLADKIVGRAMPVLMNDVLALSKNHLVK